MKNLLLIIFLLSACKSNSLGDPIKELTMHISFEKNIIKIYASKQQLLTAASLIKATNDPYNLFRFSYLKDNGGWEILSKESLESEYNYFVVSDIKYYISMYYIEITWNKDLAITLYNERDNTCSIESLFLFDESLFRDDEILLNLIFEGIPTYVVYANYPSRLTSRPMSYGLTFKEVERDEHGILFELFLINNREIEK